MKESLNVPPKPGALARSEDSPPRREFHELWFALSRTDWRSAVLVPADAGGSAESAATGLAQVGKQLHDFPVTLFVMANPTDYWPAVQIVKTAASTHDGSGVMTAEGGSIDYASAVQVAATAASGQRLNGQPSAGKVIVAIQPVVVEPLGLAVTQVADVVVLCIEVGRTRLASARRTIELVGRDRIAGCFLVTR